VTWRTEAVISTAVSALDTVSAALCFDLGCAFQLLLEPKGDAETANCWGCGAACATAGVL